MNLALLRFLYQFFPEGFKFHKSSLVLLSSDYNKNMQEFVEELLPKMNFELLQVRRLVGIKFFSPYITCLSITNSLNIEDFNFPYLQRKELEINRDALLNNQGNEKFNQVKIKN